MSVAPSLNFSLEQGANGELRLTWRDKATGAPFNLSGWTGVMRVSTRPVTELPVILGAGADNVHVVFSPSITTLFGDSTKIQYQIDLTDPDGRVKRLVKGRISVAGAIGG